VKDRLGQKREAEAEALRSAGWKAVVASLVPSRQDGGAEHPREIRVGFYTTRRGKNFCEELRMGEAKAPPCLHKSELP
jgi:hypothetical protein